MLPPGSETPKKPRRNRVETPKRAEMQVSSLKLDNSPQAQKLKKEPRQNRVKTPKREDMQVSSLKLDNSRGTMKKCHIVLNN